ncbi:hypothetical protein IHE61_21565 [Streptomyces sp. GKU 257-1]|nr:hypothetical protein [Streptomyces sp. GKU 257-1]
MDDTQRAPRLPSPDSWNRASTDETPFTADALLPRRFTNDMDIEFARIAEGTRLSREAGPSDLVRELTSRGCTEMLVGVYTEQPGPHATPENPVHVSVQVFVFPDWARARDAHGYLGDGGGGGASPCGAPVTGGGLALCPDEVYRSYRWRYSWRENRYLRVAMAWPTAPTSPTTAPSGPGSPPPPAGPRSPPGRRTTTVSPALPRRRPRPARGRQGRAAGAGRRPGRRR